LQNIYKNVLGTFFKTSHITTALVPDVDRMFLNRIYRTAQHWALVQSKANHRWTNASIGRRRHVIEDALPWIRRWRTLVSNQQMALRWRLMMIGQSRLPWQPRVTSTMTF